MLHGRHYHWMGNGFGSAFWVWLIVITAFIHGCMRGESENTIKTAPIQKNAQLTPEQVSNQFYSALDYRLGYPDPRGGPFFDIIIEFYGPALGGVDFISSYQRDPITKVTTVLTARLVTWSSTFNFIVREIDPLTRKVFTVADPMNPAARPFIIPDDYQYDEAIQNAIREGEKQWKAQLELFYWRYFLRPPTADEIAAIRLTFIEVIRAENDLAFGVAKGWLMVLYAMGASEEFWNR